MNRVLTKDDLLWDEKTTESYEIGFSIQALKRSRPLAKVGFYSSDFNELTPADCVFLQLCRSSCDLMIVGIPTDYSLRLQEKLSTFSTKERSFRVGSLVSVDYLCLYDEEDVGLCENKINPDFVFYGRTASDKNYYSNLINKEKLFLIDYPWRNERVDGKFFTI